MSFPFGHCDTALGVLFFCNSTAGFLFDYVTSLCSLRIMSLSLGKGPKLHAFANDCSLLAEGEERW